MRTCWRATISKINRRSSYGFEDCTAGAVHLKIVITTIAGAEGGNTA
jgi:hypothetical protein